MIFLVGLSFYGSYSTIQVNPELVMTVAVILFVLVVLAAIAALIISTRLRAKRDRAFELADIDQMSGIRFEQYLRPLLMSRGFTMVSITKAEGDFGADLIATSTGKKYAIQAKRYAMHNKVGVEALYQVMGGKEYYECDACMVITSSTYTPQARELAKKASILLIDRHQLKQWVGEFNNKN